MKDFERQAVIFQLKTGCIYTASVLKYRICPRTFYRTWSDGIGVDICPIGAYALFLLNPDPNPAVLRSSGGVIMLVSQNLGVSPYYIGAIWAGFDSWFDTQNWSKPGPSNEQREGWQDGVSLAGELFER